MSRPNWKHLMLGVAVAAALMTAGSSSAKACWGWGCWGGCSPCYSYSTCWSPSYYSYSAACCDPCGGYYAWRPGPIRRLLFGCYRYVPAYYTTSYCCTAYSGYSYGYGVGTVTTETMQPTPADTPSTRSPAVEAPHMPEPPAEPTPGGPGPSPAVPSPKVGGSAEEPTPSTPAPKPPAPGGLPLGPGSYTPPPSSTQVPTRANSGLLTIWVPENAIVEINGLRTKSTGSRREYVSYGLEPGKYYPYKIRALIWTSENLPGGLQEEGQAPSNEGEWEWLERTVYLTAGAQERIAFSPDPKIDQELEGLLADRQRKYFDKLAAAEQGQ